MRGGWMVLVGLMVGAPAFAQQGKVAKAEKFLTKHHGGDAKALDRAWALVGAARSHPTTRDDAGTWLLNARLVEARAAAGQASPADVLDAWDTAIGKDTAKAHTSAMLNGVLTVGSTEQARATNAFEGDRMEDAAAHLTLARRAWTLGRQLGHQDLGREIDVLQLSALTAVQLGDAAQAQAHHDALVALGERRTPTTLAVARALAQGESPEAALAFLGPIADAHPEDAALLEARLDLLLEGGDLDGARAVLDANAAEVGRSMGITLVHGRGRAALEDWPAAREAWAKAHALQPKHPEALRGYADTEIAWARVVGARAEATKKWAERRSLRAQRDQAFELARDLLQTARELDPAHLPTLERLREVYDEVEVDDPEEVQALEQAIRQAREGG